MKSPTAQTKEYLEREGWHVEKTERWIPRTKIRVDLCGCIDMLAFRGECELGVQATDSTSHSKRVAKAKEQKALRHFLRANNIFEVWSWSRRGKRGQPKVLSARVTQLTLNGRMGSTERIVEA